MHKDFYASGFLYHTRTQRILLQQKNSAENSAEWSLFGDHSLKNETVEQTFRRALEKILKLKVKPFAVKEIYTYFHDGIGNDNYVSYAKVDKLEKFSPVNGTVFNWFSFKEITKLKVSTQTKQDITIGQRVISASIRKRLGERNIE